MTGWIEDKMAKIINDEMERKQDGDKMVTTARRKDKISTRIDDRPRGDKIVMKSDERPGRRYDGDEKR